MDGAIPFPYPPEPAEQTAWASELGVAATVLLGLAWSTLVLGLGWSRRTKAAAALPGAASTVLAGVAAVAIGDAGRNPDDYLSGWLWLSIEVSAVLALIVIMTVIMTLCGPRCRSTTRTGPGER